MTKRENTINRRGMTERMKSAHTCRVSRQESCSVSKDRGTSWLRKYCNVNSG